MGVKEWVVESFIRGKKDRIQSFMATLHPDYIEMIIRAIDIEIDVVSLLPDSWVNKLGQKVPTSMLELVVSLIENEEKYAGLTEELFPSYYELLADKRNWLTGQVNRLVERINGEVHTK